ncbi:MULTISPECIES: hypothetical protein [Solidesulfovibrio]|uniref:Uncharacterized protein n=2 Tax=Solidesulfovibrio TaxID=2910984 RepID=C4XHF2_SOLM1|nr:MULTISPECIES: hypothetical protein [Solidesulfovibrio]QAZ69074.1 hypothetical protein C3Y92_18260 [Solidesulfovibrio carbinolicus]BAH73920.1 hypothetical protein DMR_04290 [Solidesulfovibrio magneticus RS-1]
MLGMEKKVRAMYGDDVESKVGNPAVEAKETANSARAGLAIGILAIVLALGVYVALDAKLSVVTQSVADVPAKVAAMDAKIAAFDALPGKLRKEMAAARLAELAATADALAVTLEGDANKASLAKVSEMIKQLKADVAK